MTNFPKEGEIYYVGAGNCMRYASYIKIKKAMNKMIDIVEIGKAIVLDKDSNLIVIPNPNDEKSEPKRFKFQNKASKYRENIDIEDRRIYYKHYYYRKFEGIVYKFSSKNFEGDIKELLKD